SSLKSGTTTERVGCVFIGGVGRATGVPCGPAAASPAGTAACWALPTFGARFARGHGRFAAGAARLRRAGDGRPSAGGSGRLAAGCGEPQAADATSRPAAADGRRRQTGRPSDARAARAEEALRAVGSPGLG